LTQNIFLLLFRGFAMMDDESFRRKRIHVFMRHLLLIDCSKWQTTFGMQFAWFMPRRANKTLLRVVRN